MPGMNNDDSKQLKQIIGIVPNCEKKDPTEPEFEREITQTDHLNKKLLVAFLGKINENPSLTARKDLFLFMINITYEHKVRIGGNNSVAALIFARVLLHLWNSFNEFWRKMDLIEEEDNEIFEDGENSDVPNEVIETNQQNGDDNNEDDNDGNENDKKPVKPKRIIRNPRAKLNAELLKGPKGLKNLEKCFERVQFKGKGYEEQDLNVMLKTYEYWCHRMFPKFPFKDCIAKIETLGTKGPIQTHLKKVRSGMIDDDIDTLDVLPDFKSDDEDNEPAPSNSAQTTSQALIADIPIELTEEQLETIRRNREKAEKLRQERLRKIREKASVNLPEKNVISDTSTCTGRSSTEVNGDNDLITQSHSIREKEISSENGCDEEEDTIRNHNKLPESREMNNVESDSDDELPTIKKCYKKVFDDDDDDEETITRVEEEEKDENRGINDSDGIEKKETSTWSKSGSGILEQMEVDE